MRKASFIVVLLALLIPGFFMRAEIQLDKESEKFLSLVRYIITDEEENMFKEYPPFEIEEFIEKFWARRDPTPTTVRNEFQEEYFRRIDEANKLFKGGIAGWLQDRGRIYILFGPPNERTQTQGGIPLDPYAPAQEQVSDPMDKEQRKSLGLGEKPSETWVYYKLLASSQVVKIDFVDRYATGNYKLVSNIEQLTAGYIDALISPDLSLIHELSKQEAQTEQEYNLLVKKLLFNFQWKFIKEKRREKDRNLLIHMEMPYERIVFNKQDDQVTADMDLFVEIRDAKQKLIWDFMNTYPLSFSQSEFESGKVDKWVINVPVSHWLKKGKYSVYIHLSNLSAEQEVKKLLTVKM